MRALLEERANLSSLDLAGRIVQLAIPDAPNFISRTY
jgi:hypothetical protein